MMGMVQWARKGFTVVELVVVIVVIAILASLVVIGYGAFQNRSAETAIKSDLKAGAATLERERTFAKGYPATAAEVNSGAGFAMSDGVSITYKRRVSSYCLDGASSRTGTSIFHIDSSDPTKIEDGPCRLIVSTLAGSGVRGYADGVRTAAQFAGPHGLAVGADGSVYVADKENHRIRVIAPSGAVSTLAGSGTAGFADGPAATARFNNPMGVTIDQTGTVFVADEANHRIRKISQDGFVSTIAGSSQGFADGSGTSALFNTPRGIAITNNGTLYVTDYNNNRIRTITPAGQVSTIAGSTQGTANGFGSAAQFNGPWGLSLGPNGDLFVADSGNMRIRRVTPAGNATTYAGTTAGFADGSAATARFSQIHDLTVAPDGTVFVADTYNHRIRKISPEGVVTTYAGVNTSGLIDGEPGTASFGETHGLAMDAYGGLYVGDYFNYVVRKIE